MEVAIGSDHAGFGLKSHLMEQFVSQLSLIDLGTHGPESVDYPDYAHKVAAMVENGEVPYGILICGSANGVCITANKHQGVRAALCWNPEIARLARAHNNANILCLPARYLDTHTANAIVAAFFEEPFEGGRHARRVDKIPLAHR
jgi:ribose 5-phosphate isomerase B